MKVKLLVLSLMLLLGRLASEAGAQTDSAFVGTTPHKQRFLPRPSTAAYLSIVPGGGQLYNRRYWKVPIVYGVLGGLIYVTEFNRKEYLRYRSAYESALAGQPHEFSSLNVPPAVLRNARDVTRKSMEESYIFLSLAYFIQIAEAYVDAHLQDFDISDDLSFRVEPAMIPSAAGTYAGLSLSIPLSRRGTGTP